METIATDVGGPLPVCKPRLVSWSSPENGEYLVRNRTTGETFRVGQEEQFILQRLDGSSTAAQVCAAFHARFGQALSAEELAEFIELAAERGFLQECGEAFLRSAGILQGRSHSKPGQESAGTRAAKRVADKLLKASHSLLQWSALRLNSAQRKIHFLRLKHFVFVPRPDDIFIVTYPRSGTTWMQMILYQLTTDGNMDIPHIAEYCPWFERSLRWARGFETQPPPRIFKSHLPYRAIPKGPCKYIYVARDGRDVVISYYHLSRMYCGFEGSFTEFFDQFIRGKVDFGSWFEHVRGWWEHRHDPNVLFLTYEELAGNLEQCIRRIIAFCGLAVPAEKLPVVLERCGFAFMKKHEARFDPSMETLWEQGVQLNSFLRAGKAGEGAVRLTAHQQEEFGQAFCRHLGPSELRDLYR